MYLIKSSLVLSFYFYYEYECLQLCCKVILMVFYYGIIDNVMH